MSKNPDIVQVNPSYRHYDKTVHGKGVIQPENNRLKWYEIARGKQPIEQGIRDLALNFVTRLTKLEGLPSAHELGFAFLHKCGQGFYFLGICTWRNNNELWKTMFYFDVGKTEDFEFYPQDERHKDTFCVWELAVVSHETLAWTTYLRSDRTKQDEEAYLTAII